MTFYMGRDSVVLHVVLYSKEQPPKTESCTEFWGWRDQEVNYCSFFQLLAFTDWRGLSPTACLHIPLVLSSKIAGKSAPEPQQSYEGKSSNKMPVVDQI